MNEKGMLEGKGKESQLGVWSKGRVWFTAHALHQTGTGTVHSEFSQRNRYHHFSLFIDEETSCWPRFLNTSPHLPLLGFFKLFVTATLEVGPTIEGTFRMSILYLGVALQLPTPLTQQSQKEMLMTCEFRRRKLRLRRGPQWAKSRGRS